MGNDSGREINRAEARKVEQRKGGKENAESLQLNQTKVEEGQIFRNGRSGGKETCDTITNRKEFSGGRHRKSDKRE